MTTDEEDLNYYLGELGVKKNLNKNLNKRTFKKL